jgi:hypothetical protein
VCQNFNLFRKGEHMASTQVAPSPDDTPERLAERIADYDRRADHHMRWYENLKLCQIICGFAIPACSLVLPKVFAKPDAALIATGVLGSAIAAIESYLQFRQYDKHWQRWRTTAMALKQEKFLFSQKAGPYADPSVPKSVSALLAERVEQIIWNEHELWIALQAKRLEKDKDNNKHKH